MEKDGEKLVEEGRVGALVERERGTETYASAYAWRHAGAE